MEVVEEENMEVVKEISHSTLLALLSGLLLWLHILKKNNYRPLRQRIGLISTTTEMTKTKRHMKNYNLNFISFIVNH